ncbi:MAG: response regulator [Anaerolineae bacterium]
MATILIIDDDPDVTRLIEFALRRAGHQVLTARDGETGLSITQAEHPDLVIADVMMPRLNGYEYCRRVRAQKDLADILILIFTARFQSVDRQAALEAGATDYLPKTVQPADLIAHVERLLGEAPAAGVPKLGEVVAAFSLRGGAGVTSLAVNLAVAVALSRRQPVALVDLSPLAGHAALMLNLAYGKGLRKALGASQQIETETLQPHWKKHDSGVHVLPSTASPGDAGEVSPGLVQPLADHLRHSFSLIVLDVPAILSGTTAAALTVADRILLIVTPDVAAVQSATVALQALDTMDVESERVWVVLNSPGGVGGLPEEAISKALKRPLAASIPYEPDMLGALNARRPLMLASPKSAAAQAIARLAARLITP